MDQAAQGAFPLQAAAVEPPAAERALRVALAVLEALAAQEGQAVLAGQADLGVGRAEMLRPATVRGNLLPGIQTTPTQTTFLPGRSRGW